MTINVTVNQLIDFATTQFEQYELFYGHGTDNAQDEAYYLVFAALGLSFDSDKSVYENIVNQTDHERIKHLIKQRCEEHIPGAYLVNKAWFADLEFIIDERALIPRSPFAELILEGFSPWCDIQQVKNVLEVGTGGGCIAIALAHYFPHIKVDAVDIDDNALELARINCEKHGLNKQVSFMQSDVFNKLEKNIMI